ncbi:hypothetical protein WMY93_022370 [Mugilogobius chulae]|uniref:B30.2/SPRY domain-containing protein n=1 Tax=Mugilogobius chulae TaxID=88201 RepID=A0AAW0N7Y6_9GOBI
MLFILDGLDECRISLDFSRTRVLTDPTESAPVSVLLVTSSERNQAARSLTQMYIHFLVVQAKVRHIKYEQGSGADLQWTPETRDMVLSLAKLAFKQLEKGNLIFYERDLRECGLNAAAASVYSGVFTQIFREEPGLYQDKVYCFIHLSVQEFMAALHVHHIFFSSGKNLLESSQSSESPGLVKKIKEDMREGYQYGRSPAGWSAMAFLLLSSDSDLEEFDLTKYQRSSTALVGLLPVIKASTKAILSGCDLSRDICGRLVSVLNSSSLTHLDLSNNDLQDSGVEELCVGLRRSSCRLLTLSLNTCSLSQRICGSLVSVLRSSSLTELDLSNNDLQDFGVEVLCPGLRSATCRLHTLKLSGCLVSETGGASLVSALSSAHSQLKELDLRYNHPGSSAKLLIDLQKNPHCPLQTLRLDPAGERWMMPSLRNRHFLLYCECSMQKETLAGETSLIKTKQDESSCLGSDSCEFSLDLCPTHKYLLLSEDKLTVSREDRLKDEVDSYSEDSYDSYHSHQAYKDSSIDKLEVLSSTGLSGRCYWEVIYNGIVEIAVSHSPPGSTGESSRFGDDDQSWSLHISYDQFWSLRDRFCVRHNKTDQWSSNVDLSDSVGVFLDSEAGALSFYEVGPDGKLLHFHTISSPFTEPLYAAFRLLEPGSSVSVVSRAPPGGHLS